MCNYAQVEFFDGKRYKQAAKATLKIRGENKTASERLRASC